MAATDQTYRNQRTLDIVFAVSCIALLGSTVWMFAQDYYRPFKDVQRKFRDVETALNERLMLDQLPDPEVFEEARQAVVDARAELAAKEEEVKEIKQQLQAEYEARDNAYRAVKADYDSIASYYNIDIEHLGKAEVEERSDVESLRAQAESRRGQLSALEAELRRKQDDLDETKVKIREQIDSKLAGHRDARAEAERQLKDLTGAFDRFAKASAQKTWKPGDTFRALPILDGFESPTKINQYHLPDLTIDYGGFEDVPRYDRCSTCHLGIERGIFDRASLTALGEVPGELWDKLDTAHAMFQDRKEGGETLGYEPGDLPTETNRVPMTLGLVLAGLGIVGSIALCLLGLTRPGTVVGVGGVALGLVVWGTLNLVMTGKPTIKKVELTEGEVTQFAAHPRLDLFVDANSPHKAEDFGCTICHEGQGSATDFFNAAHSPDNFGEAKEWEEQYHWHRSHYWDFPMLPHRFVESSCIKCHHNVTDLIRDGSKEEAPKLLKGYRLLRDNGCFGCHEIPGQNKGREVGPDMRLEPSPALEYLTAARRELAENDKANPPGTLRKVGPSLRRLAEKTDGEWTATWVGARGAFRPDTKMAHFYGLSTNSKEAIEAEAEAITDPKIKEAVLRQVNHPHTEMQAISHYLIHESKGALGLLPTGDANPNGSDAYRNLLRVQLGALHAQLKANPLPDREWRALQKAAQQLWELALLSVPTRKALINDAYAGLEALHDQIRRAHNRDADAKVSDEEGKDLDSLAQRLLDYSRPVPVSKEIRDGQGNIVTIPDAPAEGDAKTKHLELGKKLFTEKGCLACHSHKGAAVQSDAQFGPELSRIAAKLKPAVEGGQARRWLAQWILNPNYHHPRTKMPVTHLEPAQAAAVADWLLSQNADWQGEAPEQPTKEDLIHLARVYLVKAPGFTPTEVDKYLPADGEPEGIPAERLTRTTFDADERVLGEMTEDNLKWYIGKKAIGRLGCYGCHDIPGFEGAKPIGTALADWGKKDPARLAFEDAAIFVKNTYHLVPSLDGEGEEAFAPHDGKEPYEEFFYHSLEHHQREGFLYQKLIAPRSYDYHRLRTWDDRLRMPQFRFARLRQDEGENDGEFAARQAKQEAEAREAVMTFVLGLLAEPIPLKYVARPDTDRLAEVHGRKVLEKYNCAGCHQVRAGVYDVNLNSTTLRGLETAHGLLSNLNQDLVFPRSNAWVGKLPTGEKMTVRGVNLKVEEVAKDALANPLDGGQGINVQEALTLTLTQAVGFTDAKGQARDLPAGTLGILVGEEITSRSPPFGGEFANLMVPYVASTYATRLNDEPKQRSVLPPPLIREGERVQTAWLHQFLLDPGVIRPADWMILRMPRFNLSEDEASQLVNYFAAVSRRQNPGVGVTYPYLTRPQEEEQYWKVRSEEYLARLKKDNKLDERVQYMKPLWEKYAKDQLTAAETRLETAKQVLKDSMAGGEAEVIKQNQEAVRLAQAEIDRWKKTLQEGTFADLRKEWEQREIYATDAYRLLMGRPTVQCLQCHSVGDQLTPGEQGPNLALAADRLRPEWTFQWLGNPERLFPHTPLMPQNFQKEDVKYQEFFVGDSRAQARATRDILMRLRQAGELPGVRYMPPAGAAPAPGGGNE